MLLFNPLWNNINKPWGVGRAVFGGGSSSAFNGTNVIRQYTFATNTWASSTTLTFAPYYVAAGGNETEAIFGGGQVTTPSPGPTNTTNKYNYNANVCAVGTNLARTRSNAAGTADANNAYFLGGAGVTITELYNFSSDTVSDGGAINNPPYKQGAAAGNDTQAAILGADSGAGANNVTIYNYAAGSTSPGPSLANGLQSSSACGLPSMGLYGGGYDNTAAARTAATWKYTYGAGTLVSGTALSVPRNLLAATNSDKTGVFGGGIGDANGSYYSTVDLYAFATDTVTAGASLGTPTNDLAAASSPNGGLTPPTTP
ncbi:kelch-motif containing protein [Burkholderia phage BcepSaruman]|uniref:Kelch-motif containing protein n=1 Tax=Burkholderia phage BcepSaruman TaxID=2530032 RepID=A0A4D5ZBY9_9CAUD|nr:kelch-motif containing protein [Burkholderia phage BcepSaruman]QBX06523.1 kelch-motif containing protein [Burkholderia phage BcepSaruman]